MKKVKIMKTIDMLSVAKEHLRYFGFTVEDGDGEYYMMTRNDGDGEVFTIHQMEDGIAFEASCPLSDNVNGDVEGAIQSFFAYNNESKVSTAVAEDGDVVIMAWYSMDYDVDSFARFVTGWLYDLNDGLDATGLGYYCAFISNGDDEE